MTGMSRAWRWGAGVAGIFLFVNFVLALFERLAPPGAVRFYMKYIGNPALRWVSGMLPGFAVLEVVGRKTGRRYRVNVGGREIGNAFWLLARADAQYVRNLQSNPDVRIKFNGRWRDGIAHVLSDLDPSDQLLRLNPMNGAFLWLVGTNLLTVRVDLAEMF